MSQAPPDPMTPAECDLRGLPFMPLDVVRLGDSDLVALSTGEEFKAAVMLWCKAWLQVPAASLPDDPRILAHLSGAGTRWAKVREVALRGWVRCSDGRLYHPVIAEKAREAWSFRVLQRERSKRANEKRWGSRGDAATHADGMPGASPKPPQQAPAGIAGASPNDPHGDARGDPKGQGQGQGQSTSLRSASPARGTRLPTDWQPGDADRAFARSLGLDPDAVAEEFRDFWCALPGSKALKLDWSATFHNRCREVAGRRRGGAPIGSGSPAGAGKRNPLDWMNQPGAFEEVVNA
ncbi:DUF1376 domain-containing protein [Pararoseomonas indoligenes]|uniref:DUF1376 domain-containing protein n=1 Tax=Roseomonas indoligenes TaxID=2820811 RepID=A0A940MW66_9PROT|nr:DUF1376 domain-containing protein [Pararoseomonas indoligenes]MBP0492105.1 DUF1376 domain-containing protein [Pararoseomonas indoligenes]